MPVCGKPAPLAASAAALDGFYVINAANPSRRTAGACAPASRKENPRYM